MTIADWQPGCLLSPKLSQAVLPERCGKGKSGNRLMRTFRCGCVAGRGMKGNAPGPNDGLSAGGLVAPK